MRLCAAAALLPDGLGVRTCAIDIGDGGMIARVARERGAADGAERVAGPLVPGMPNVHSHAFQRALAGRTGHATEGGDSFWTWRRRCMRCSTASTPTPSRRSRRKRMSRC